MNEVVLNQAQRNALAWYFSADNQDGEPHPLDEPFVIEVDVGELAINGNYLHTDGEWATHSEVI